MLFYASGAREKWDAELLVEMRVENARLHKEIGATMIYLTQDQVSTITLADKTVVLRGGYIEQGGAPLDLYRGPDNRFVAGFIGSPEMNFLAGHVVDGGVDVPAFGADRFGFGDVSCDRGGGDVRHSTRVSGDAISAGRFAR